jgi:hypothetical protein
MMRTRRRTFTISVVGLAGLAVIAIAIQAQRLRAGAPAIAAAAAVQDAAFSIDPDTMVGWNEGPAQPVFFSHRRHAGVYEIQCLYCHSNTDLSPIASMPPLEVCLGCHRVVQGGSSEIAKLRGYEQQGEAIPWERIYKLADFVQFNHGRHILAELECEECHGKVEETDVLYQWSSMTMGWCLECHREPGEDEAKLAEAHANAERFTEEGRESPGLYPKSIDSDYGVTKGPIDCAACHY